MREGSDRKRCWVKTIKTRRLLAEQASLPAHSKGFGPPGTTGLPHGDLQGALLPRLFVGHVVLQAPVRDKLVERLLWLARARPGILWACECLNLPVYNCGWLALASNARMLVVVSSSCDCVACLAARARAGAQGRRAVNCTTRPATAIGFVMMTPGQSTHESTRQL